MPGGYGARRTGLQIRRRVSSFIETFEGGQTIDGERRAGHQRKPIFYYRGGDSLAGQQAHDIWRSSGRAGRGGQDFQRAARFWRPAKDADYLEEGADRAGGCVALIFVGPESFPMW